MAALQGFKDLNELVSIILECENYYTFAQFSCRSSDYNFRSSRNNPVAMVYPDNLKSRFNGLLERNWLMVPGGKGYITGVNKSDRNPFKGISIGSFKPDCKVKEIIYPEIKPEHFSTVFYEQAKNFLKEGGSIEWLLFANSNKTTGGMFGKPPKGVKPFYVAYDPTYGFSNEQPTILIAEEIPNAQELEAFAKKKGINTKSISEESE